MMIVLLLPASDAVSQSLRTVNIVCFLWRQRLQLLYPKKFLIRKAREEHVDRTQTMKMYCYAIVTNLGGCKNCISLGSISMSNGNLRTFSIERAALAISFVCFTVSSSGVCFEHHTINSDKMQIRMISEEIIFHFWCCCECVRSWNCQKRYQLLQETMCRYWLRTASYGLSIFMSNYFRFEIKRKIIRLNRITRLHK